MNTRILKAEKWDHLFAPIPAEMRDTGRIPSLAELGSLQVVGAAGIALLPLFAMFGAQGKTQFHFSQRQLATHFGISVRTIAKMRTSLASRLVRTEVRDFYHQGT